MFFAMAAKIYVEKQGDLYIANSLIQSFTTHARSLHLFFYSEKPRSDDATAEHFVLSEINWKKVRPPISPNLEKLYSRVGKEVAHLTYSRADVGPNSKGWSFPLYIVDFAPVFEIFARSADPKKLHRNFLEAGNRWLQLFHEKGIIKILPRNKGSISGAT
jgi:hypothetical protein